MLRSCEGLSVGVVSSDQLHCSDNRRNTSSPSRSGHHPGQSRQNVCSTSTLSIPLVISSTTATSHSSCSSSSNTSRRKWYSISNLFTSSSDDNCSRNSSRRSRLYSFSSNLSSNVPTTSTPGPPLLLRRLSFSSLWSPTDSTESYCEQKTTKELSSTIEEQQEYNHRDQVLVKPEEVQLEEVQPVSVVPSSKLQLRDVLDLVYEDYCIDPGTCTANQEPILVFPDTKQNNLSESEYKKLLVYLTSSNFNTTNQGPPPVVQSAEQEDNNSHEQQEKNRWSRSSINTGGPSSSSFYVLILDRRNEKWNSIKSLLLRISTWFPCPISVVYLVRPLAFLQRALTEVSVKLLEPSLSYELVVVRGLAELLTHFTPAQLTRSLGGTVDYNKFSWAKLRLDIENYAAQLGSLSTLIQSFTRSPLPDLPNEPEVIQEISHNRCLEVESLLVELRSLSWKGEELLEYLKSIKKKNQQSTSSGESLESYEDGWILFVERSLLQLDETGIGLQRFWKEQNRKLSFWKELKSFQAQFRNIAVLFGTYTQDLNDLVEDNIINGNLETINEGLSLFKKKVEPDLDQILVLESIGRKLLLQSNTTDDEEILLLQTIVEPKCTELYSIHKQLRSNLDYLTNTFSLLDATSIKVKFICGKKSVEEGPSCDEPTNVDDLESLESCIEQVLKYRRELRTSAHLQKFPNLHKQLDGRLCELEIELRTRKEEIYSRRVSRSTTSNRISSSSPVFSPAQHVLQELLSTEQNYVSQLAQVITGYRERTLCEGRSTGRGLNKLVPTQFRSVEECERNVEILFCNLDRLHSFHERVLLPDLTNCTQSPQLTALCFIQRSGELGDLYWEYCTLKPSSDRLYEALGGDSCSWFLECQAQLGHPLPLSSYLLKPVQRITKYHLLLASLLQCCKGSEDGQQKSNTSEEFSELEEALESMIILLKSVNDGMNQLHIRNYPGRLSSEGRLLLQGGDFKFWILDENSSSSFRPSLLRLRSDPTRDNSKLTSTSSRSNSISSSSTTPSLISNGSLRYLFLYTNSLLVTKKLRSPSSTTGYDFRTKISLAEIGLTEEPHHVSKSHSNHVSKKFEIWSEGRRRVYLIQAPSPAIKLEWVRRIKELLLGQLEVLRNKDGTSGLLSTTKKGQQESTASYNAKNIEWNKKSKKRPSSWLVSVPPQIIDPLVTPQSQGSSGLRADWTNASIMSSDGSYGGGGGNPGNPPAPLLPRPTNPGHYTTTTSSTESINCRSFPSLGDSSFGSYPTTIQDEEEDPIVDSNLMYIAEASYVPMDERELELEKGQVVRVLKKGCAGWWFVQKSTTDNNWSTTNCSQGGSTSSATNNGTVKMVDIGDSDRGRRSSSSSLGLLGEKAEEVNGVNVGWAPSAYLTKI